MSDGAPDVPNILYIDDDPAFGRLVSREMKRRGLAVATALSGADGLRALEMHDFDAIALDHYMPERDGLEVLQDLALLDHAPPVVFVTGSESGRLAVQAIKTGAVDYVVKDVDPSFFDLLERALRAAVDADRLERAAERAEQELMDREERLRLALVAGNMGAWEWDITTDRLTRDVAFDSLWGIDADELAGRDIVSQILEADRESEADRFKAFLNDGREFSSEFRIKRRNDDQERWLQIRAIKVDDTHGPRIIGVATDITERRLAEERQTLLLRELTHRVKNILTLVQSIGDLSARGSKDIQTFLRAYRGRLAALAVAHDQLVKGTFSGAEMRDVVEGVLAPYVVDETRLSFSVPSLRIAPSAAQTLALVLNELVTNAVKYGAWSTPQGHLSLKGEIVDDAEKGRVLVLTWEEVEGPDVVPPERAGFGMMMLRQAVEHQFSGTSRMEWHSNGLFCELRLPVRDLQARSGHDLSGF